MPRTVQITVPSTQTESLVAQVSRLDELVSLKVQRNISVHPPGDVVTVQTTNRALHPLMRLLVEQGIGTKATSSISTSAPSSLISSSHVHAVTHDVSESSWEEMETVLVKESNMSLNSLLVVGFVGVIATMALASNSLHLMIGAMVIMPGFEPLTRVALGLVARSSAWKRGLIHTAKGYAALIASAAATTLLLSSLGVDPRVGGPSYLPAGSLVSYWSTITPLSLLVATAASTAGVLLVLANRSVLTAGVMIALALVPSATLVGVGLAMGDIALAGRGLVLWLIDVGFVTACSALVLLWKRLGNQKRKMLI
jgi:hypothetical protein